jgi:hypothetical protein
MAATTNPEKELSTLLRQIRDGLNESGMAELIDRVAAGAAEPAEIERLRNQVGELWTQIHSVNAENTRLRDQQLRDITERNEYEKRVREAADAQAQRDARDYATLALRDLLDPLRKLLAATSRLDERTLPHEVDAIRRDAQSLNNRLRNDPAPAAAEKVVADMEAARSALIRDKKRLWNALQIVSLVIQMHMEDLLAFGEQGSGDVVGKAMQWWREQYDEHSAGWSDAFRRAVADSLNRWETT